MFCRNGTVDLAAQKVLVVQATPPIGPICFGTRPQLEKWGRGTQGPGAHSKEHVKGQHLTPRPCCAHVAQLKQWPRGFWFLLLTPSPCASSPSE